MRSLKKPFKRVLTGFDAVISSKYASLILAFNIQFSIDRKWRWKTKKRDLMGGKMKCIY